jgi:hypothetical protein
VAGTQCSAVNKHNLTLGHIRLIIIKEILHHQNTDRSHNREKNLKVPWEGKIEREEEK